ncbi:MAG: hypothetical protein K2W95_34665 [Candidatus Obscuribacterales bacterium]|nr:hypothetical protein [Candidatus Obscuribacterales bacterium]
MRILTRKRSNRRASQTVKPIYSESKQLRSKFKQHKSEPMLVTLRNALAWIFRELTKGTVKVNKAPMCANYGHVISRSWWKAGQPVCTDCGATLKTAAELRASSPKILPN